MADYNILDLKERLKDLGDALQIHNIESYYSQYYEFNFPFSIQIATNRSEESINAYHLATFAPGFQNIISSSNFLLDLARETPSLHHNNCTKLMYVLEGRLYQNIEGKQILYTPGSCCMMNRDIRHTEAFTTDYQVVFFNFSENFVERLFNFGHGFLFDKDTDFSSMLLDYMMPKKGGTPRSAKAYLDFYPVLYEDRQKQKMHDIFEKMIWIMLNPAFGATFSLQALVFELIEILSSQEYYQTTLIHPSSNSDALVFARVNQLLADNHGRIKRKELESLLNYSGSHISRIVKKFTGLSLFDYSMTFCLSAAAEMLLNTTDSITCIMEQLQFTNQTHFYHLFREKYGVSPKEYRGKQF